MGSRGHTIDTKHPESDRDQGDQIREQQGLIRGGVDRDILAVAEQLWGPEASEHSWTVVP